jgi:hypothetical protein
MLFLELLFQVETLKAGGQIFRQWRPQAEKSGAVPGVRASVWYT